MKKDFKVMDGNEAAAYVSYAFTEISTIYPITPSSPMAEHVDAWAAQGKKNLFGQPVRLVEMQSEAGAIGAMHGSLESGALTTSYTASQGLMLMIPTMYRLSGELLPGVLHVSSRTVGTHAFSIFGDHSDVMSCRQTGFALFSTGSVQEVMDLAAVAHLSAIEGRVPFLHFFDGFRTSHEVQKVEVMDYEALRPLLNEKALQAFRQNALNPDHPVQRSTVQNPDIFFQGREAANRYYDALPGIVEKYITEINRITGRHYGLFNYYGSPEAERVIVAMGSVSGTIQETVDYLLSRGEKVGYLQAHLFRPFSMEHFLRELPATVKSISVLDRTKEPGSAGEPLYEEICTAFVNRENPPKLYAGRYGLSSKETTPAHILSVFENMKNETPKNHFTVGISDDVTHHSLPAGAPISTGNPETVSCKFWGFGSDGTVGANQNSIRIIGENTEKYVQAYFEFDAKKSGGVTKSHLRISDRPIRSSYLVNQADFAACHKESYIEKYDIVSEIRPGGAFLLNCSWDASELVRRLPAAVKREVAQKQIRFYTIDATKIAWELGLGNRTNTVLQAAFFRLTGILPIEYAKEQMKKAIYDSYHQKGEKVLRMNYAAVDRGAEEITAVSVPESWENAQDAPSAVQIDYPDFVRDIMIPVNDLKGDSLPVSAFAKAADGTYPLGTSKYEKRGVAVRVPVWQPDECIQCNQCSFYCPHAAIRPFLLSGKEIEAAPESYRTIPAVGKELDLYAFRIQVDPLDCTGCGVCEKVCVSKNKAIRMEPLDSQRSEAVNWDYSLALSEKVTPENRFTVRNSQFEQPLLEFSGACAGCGETPYMKVLTQLFGDRMYLANATGCSQAWGATVPCMPYVKNSRGHGPAFSNSLFENNAEFSLGMCLAVKQQRDHLKISVEKLLGQTGDEALSSALREWLDGYDQEEGTRERGEAVARAIKEDSLENDRVLCKEILQSSDHLAKKSMWMYGGDGWAYDIGFGGLDHVLASGEDVNILVVDTEVYSNTGGQSSKATPTGAVAQFAVSGKKTGKKDLGFMALSYGNIYVAQVAMGADPAQYMRVLREAASYHGPSLIIAYAPCISHGIVKGMSGAPLEAKLAVRSGYWNLYHYDPRRREEGMNPFVLDSKEPDLPLESFLMGETRFAALHRTFPEQAKLLFEKEQKDVAARLRQYRQCAERCE